MENLSSYSDCIDRVNKALALLTQYDRIPGGPEKAWVVDQAIRALARDDYDRVMSESNADTTKGWFLVIMETLTANSSGNLEY